MEIEEIGRMIYTLRTKKAISQEELCRGICSIATLSRLEAGERRPDIFIFNAFFQRLGKSASHISIVMTLEEFEYFVKRRNIEISISAGKSEQAEIELNEFEQELKEKGMPLKRQDIYRLHALLYITVVSADTDIYENYLKAQTYIDKALLETIPNLDELKADSETFFNRLRFCEAELNLFLVYAYIREALGENIEELLESINHYIRLRITDKKAFNKYLACVLYLQAHLYRKQLLWQQCFECCETAIAAEVNNGEVDILFQCLEMELECLENGIDVKEGRLRRKQYESLKMVLEKYGNGVSVKNFSFLGGEVSQEKSLIDEVIHYSRMRSEYSQAEFSEGICTPETLSRIETGKRNPTVKNFYALMKKSGLNIGYYNTDFVVKKFETLEKVDQLTYYAVLRKHEAMEKILEEVEKELDFSVNRQMLEMYRTVFNYRLGRLTIEEALKKIEDLAELSLKKKDGKFEVPYQPSPAEIALLNQIAVYYRNMGKQKQAVEILMPLYEYFHQSKLDAPEYNQRYFMVVSNLGSYLEEIDELEKSSQMYEEVLSASIKYNNGFRLGNSIIGRAYVQERMNGQNYLEEYERGYYLCGLYEDAGNKRAVQKHVWENYHITYED